MPLRLEDIVSYRGFMQPDRWKLHPDDFAVRMAWERDRQRILDAQAEAIEKRLPEPKEKVPPIPRLKHPGYHLLRTVAPVTSEVTVTQTPQSVVTPVTHSEDDKRRKNREKVARHRAKKKGHE